MSKTIDDLLNEFKIELPKNFHPHYPVNIGISNLQIIQELQLPAYLFSIFPKFTPSENESLLDPCIKIELYTHPKEVKTIPEVFQGVRVFYEFVGPPQYSP